MRKLIQQNSFASPVCGWFCKGNPHHLEGWNQVVGYKYPKEKMDPLTHCLLGGVAGIILGIAIGNLISHLMNIDAFIVPWLWMLVGLIVCVVVGLISGYYPAWKASKLDPIESLRFE